jgi:Carboxypeptidase regulatory-like domain/TonB dependent receptor
MRRTFLSALLWALWVPSCVFGQALVTGKITGVVTDSSGSVIGGAIISVEGPALMSPQSAKTGTDGSYLINLVPPGRYTVTVTASGFQTFVQQNVDITAGYTATVNASLKLGALTQRVVVGETAPVDVSTATTSTTFGTDLLQKVPTGNDPWSTVALTAGEVQDQMDVGGSKSFYQSTTEVHGSIPGEQVYSFNGLAMNWPEGSNSYTSFYINRDDLQEFDVVTDNAGANISVGGVYMNMVTRSGTNEWHGDAAAYYLTSAFQSQMNFPVFDGTTDHIGTPFVMARNTTVDAGGPILRDRWWIFGSYGRYDTREDNPAILNPNGSVSHSTNHQSNTLLRSDWQINPKNRINFNWWWNEQNQFDRFDGTFVYPEATWLQIEPCYNLQGQWTSFITPDLSLDTRAGWQHLLFPLSYEPGVGPNDIPIDDIATGVLSGAAIFQQVNNTDVIALASTASYVKSNWGGAHLFQVGVEFTDGRNRYLYLANHNLEEFLDNGAPYQVTVYNTPSDAREVYHNLSFFGQDAWKIKQRLTLNLGVRFEHFVTFYPGQSRVAATDFPTLFPAESFAASGSVVDWNTVSPRIGVAFDPTGKGNQVFRASFGIFEFQEGTGPAELVNPNAFSTLTYTWTGATDSNGLPTGFLSSPPVAASGGVDTVIDPNLKRPYSEEVSVGYERTVLRSVQIGLNYYYRTNKNQMVSNNLDTPLTDWTPAAITNPLTNQPLNVYDLNPAQIGLFKFLLTTEPALNNNRYDGVDITAQKHFSDNWQVLGGFTVSRNIGEYTTGSGDNFNDPNLNINRANNYLNDDATYALKLASTYVVPHIGLSFSGSYQHYSGYPFQPQASVALPQGSETINLLPAGILRLPDRDLLSVRFSRPFTFRERYRLEPIIDLFNVTNSASNIGKLNFYGTITGSTFAASPSYELPTDMLNPRVMRLGLKFGF